MANKVGLRTYEHYGYKEGVAAETITPGHLVELNSSGNIQKHSTDGGEAAPKVALEAGEIGEEIDDDYETDEQIKFAFGIPGEEFNMILDSDSDDVSIGSKLESTGDGTLTLQDTGEVVAIALEAASPGTDNVRIKVEVL